MSENLIKIKKILQVLIVLSILCVFAQFLVFIPSIRLLLVYFLQRVFHKFMITEVAMINLKNINSVVFFYSTFVLLILLLIRYSKNTLRSVVAVFVYGFILSTFYGFLRGNVSGYCNSWNWGDFSIPVINAYAASNFIDSNYPPFALVFYKFVNLFLQTSGEQLIDSHNYLITLIFLFGVICSLVCVFLLYQGSQKEKLIFASVIFITGPILFAFQRMNIVLFTLPLILFFLLCHNSENKVLRELSIIALAVAGNFKLYPTIFILILVKEKKWIQFVRCFVYIIILFMVPIIFFNDKNVFALSIDQAEKIEQIENIEQVEQIEQLEVLPKRESFLGYIKLQNDSVKKLFCNMVAFSTGRGTLQESLGITKTISFKGLIYRTFFSNSILSDAIIKKVLSLLLVLLCIFMCWLFFAVRKGYQSLAVLGLMCVLIPTMNAYYSAILLIPAFCLCVCKSDKDVWDYINVVFFVAMFIYLNFDGNKLFSVWSCWHYVGLLVCIAVEQVWKSKRDY